MLWVDGIAHITHLEVEMAAEGASGISAEADDIAALHLVASRDKALRHVGVVGFEAVGMVNDDEVTVALVAFGDAHHAIEGSINGFAGGLSQVETIVEAAATRSEVARGSRGPRRRPGECTSGCLVA